MDRLHDLIQRYCPNGVVFARIADIADISIGEFVHKSKQSPDGKYPVYNGGTTNTGFYDDFNRTANKIIISARGANAGYVNRVFTNFWSGNSCYSIDVENTNADWNFVFYCLKNGEKKLLGEQQKGGIPAVSKKQVEQFRIPLPPLAVQQEIVRILDSFTELTAELTARRKQYEHYRDELLTFGDDVPSLPISQIATFKYGYTDKAQDAGDARFIRITDITDDGCLNPLDAKYINMTEESKKYLLTKGDLLLARTGASYGKTLYYPDNSQAVYASFLIKIKPDNTKILNRFYWHFSKSSLYWTQAEKLVSKGGQQQFNTGAIGRVLIPVPSLDEQRRIVSILDRFDAICNDLASGLPAEIAARQKQYEYYRDKLLMFKELER